METKVIPNLEDVIKELALPEWLNGKEASFLKLNTKECDLNHLMETCRCLQSLYDIICSARLNLACACRKEYPELLDANNTQLSHIWMSSQFLNNAILWYNAAFDLALQPLWVYYKIYTGGNPNLRLTTANLDKILEQCRFEKLKRNGDMKIGDPLITNLERINANMQNNIRLWANNLKHRKKMEYAELSKKTHLVSVGGTFSMNKDENGNTILKIKEGEYNSSKTIERINMDYVINTLITFHKELILLTKDIVTKIGLQDNWYGVI